jgi:excisionase family DNA binding protein
LERFPGGWTPRPCGERRDAKEGGHRVIGAVQVASFVFDMSELEEVVERTVAAVVRRNEERQPKDAAGRVLLTKKEAAEALGVSPATIDRLRKAGLPAVKLDGKVLFRPEGLRAWAAAQESVLSGG